MISARALRSDAETLAAPFPPLLAEARQLAATVLLGAHGRRRAGVGDNFWQYRPAQSYDEARHIDWRRSARGDVTYVQDKEWQVAQSVMLWIDRSAAMRFVSDRALPSKLDRARTLGLATAVLLDRGGERVGLAGANLPPRGGAAQLERLAHALSEDDSADYGAPTVKGLPAQARAVFISDFLGDITPVQTALDDAARRGIAGSLLHILDPQEEAFPFDGRTIFESMGGQIQHETLKAGDLRTRYMDRLAARKAQLQAIARNAGWHYSLHHTSQSANNALLWLFTTLEQQR